MSRSYKHTGWIQDQSGKKHGKRFANKRVRRFDSEIPSGSSYKKIYNSWDIADYILQARGVLSKVVKRPGRFHRKVRVGGPRSPFWRMDLEDRNRLWRDWRK